MYSQMEDRHSSHHPQHHGASTIRKPQAAAARPKPDPDTQETAKRTPTAHSTGSNQHATGAKLAREANTAVEAADA